MVIAKYSSFKFKIIRFHAKIRYNGSKVLVGKPNFCVGINDLVKETRAFLWILEEIMDEKTHHPILIGDPKDFWKN